MLNEVVASAVDSVCRRDGLAIAGSRVETGTALAAATLCWGRRGRVSLIDGFQQDADCPGYCRQSMSHSPHTSIRGCTYALVWRRYDAAPSDRRSPAFTPVGEHRGARLGESTFVPGSAHRLAHGRRREWRYPARRLCRRHRGAMRQDAGIQHQQLVGFGSQYLKVRIIPKVRGSLRKEPEEVTGPALVTTQLSGMKRSSVIFRT